MKIKLTYHSLPKSRDKLFIILYLLLSVRFSIAQIPAPAPPQDKKILLLNGVAHLGNGKVIENSAIAFENGKLTIVADATNIRLDMARFDTIIYVKGKHIYPGFIAPNSTLGLVEIGAVRATRDYDDAGNYLPHVRSLIAYNTDSKIIPTVRSNGVLLAQVTPRGGTISGTSSIVELDAWNWEDAAYKTDDGIHLNWPRMNRKKAQSGTDKKKNIAGEKLKAIRSFFENAKAYSEIQEHIEKNLRFEAMRGLFDGSKTLFIHVDFAKEIMQAVNFVRELEIKKTVVVGGYDSWMVTDMLKENNIAVILRRVHSLPMRHDDDIDLPYKLPYLLHKAGVLYCLNNAGGMEAMGARNLPFYAGTAATYGLTKEEALMAITSNTAKILGIEKTVGTLATGKDATLIVSTGDALDMRGNHIEMAFIRGKFINLDNHQKQLYEKFKAKYETQKE